MARSGIDAPGDWPARAEALEAGRSFLARWARSRLVLAPDGDADGLSAGLILARTIERLGGSAQVVFTGKGESPHSEPFRERLRAAAPDALVVADQGSRADPLLAGVPTLLVDHHQPRGLPDGAVIVSAFGHEPVASSSLLAWELCAPLAELGDSSWLAFVGAVGDLGADASVPGLKEGVRRWGRTSLAAAVARVNAPRRSAGHEVALAWEVLKRARSPREIARGEVPGAEELERLRREVSEEARRCAATRPRFSGDWALVLFASPAKVHALVARRWRDRLPRQIVVAANAGYLPGRVHFSVRSARPENLIERLLGLGVSLPGDFAHGHPQATGGAVPTADFERLLAAMGFPLRAEGAEAGPSLSRWA